MTTKYENESMHDGLESKTIINNLNSDQRWTNSCTIHHHHYFQRSRSTAIADKPSVRGYHVSIYFRLVMCVLKVTGDEK